jgi:prepilin-type processing-associated H-X9-DG protein
VAFKYRWSGPEELILASELEPSKEVKYVRVSDAPVDLIKPGSMPIHAGTQTPEGDVEGACMTNMRQSAQAALMYSVDWDETWPQSGNWASSLLPYVKTRSVFSCPQVSNENAEGGYAMNSALSSARRAQVQEPPKSVLFFESAPGTTEGDAATSEIRVPRHQGQINRAYADGHVTSAKP